uniref:TSA: Wollemia nobilis Ref_Wollemi_Transcript_12305_979 transcribed RNA sequence n=1 Tax=Wollemia nobilis TaxID=56998 RepID=A0A0C9S610_9CONI
MNRAIVQKVFPGSNPAESLALVWKEKPQAMAGKVVVRMTASAINPIDLKYIRSGFLARFSHKGAILGSEGVGVIHEVGEGVSSYKLGERVIPVVFFKYYVEEGEGAWQDYLHVEEEDLVRVPDSIPDSIAAQFVINPWTVYGMLSDLCIPKSKYLVQTAAASVFGRQCIQLAKYWGIKTINIVRREELKEELKDLGADEVINSETEDIIKRVREITNGEGAYACIDAVGGILTKVVAGCVRDKGKVIVYGRKTFALENFKEAIKESEAYARGGKIILIN